MQTVTIRVSRECRKELRLLKEAWALRSLDEVIVELIRPHRLDKVRALGIKVDHADTDTV